MRRGILGKTIWALASSNSNHSGGSCRAPSTSTSTSNNKHSSRTRGFVCNFDRQKGRGNPTLDVCAGTGCVQSARRRRVGVHKEGTMGRASPLASSQVQGWNCNPSLGDGRRRIELLYPQAPSIPESGSDTFLASRVDYRDMLTAPHITF
jgi:hypothetical protein